MFHKRVVQHPLMQAFDGPDAQASCGRRENTTVAPQALALLNDKFVRERARDFAERVMAQAEWKPDAQVRLAWRLALGRDPSAAELGAAVSFIESQLGQSSGRESSADTAAASKLSTLNSQPPTLRALTDFCQAIFAMNEFIYVD